MDDKITILNVLVGSHAHGLADENSDKDYRGVYVLPTSKILSLNYRYKGTTWIEGDEDNTSYEIGHFLQLATKCNPTILEVFKAPIVEANEDGKALRELFSYIWDPKRSFDAFTGYGYNQRKKFLAKKDNRQNKYAVAHIRTLFNLLELLRTKDFHVEIPKCVFRNRLLEYKRGDYMVGDIIQHSEDLKEDCEIILPQCEHEANIDKVNEFLISIRKKYWNGKS